MIRVAQLGYVECGVDNIKAWCDFAYELVGLDVREEKPDEALIRYDDASYRLRLVKDPVKDVRALGWSVSDEETLQAFAAQLEKAGVAVTKGTAQECKEREVLSFMHFTDLDGIRMEVYQGLRVRFAEPLRTAYPHSGFVTGSQGMGHVGLWVKDLQASVDFYSSVLGLRVTDWVDSKIMHAAFLRCNPRQHSVALFQSRPERAVRLHHISLENVSLDDVGRAYDKAQERQIVIGTLGKHPAEQAVTFYMKSPAGFGFELGWAPLQIDNATWQVSWHDEKATWGHRFLGLMD